MKATFLGAGAIVAVELVIAMVVIRFIVPALVAVATLLHGTACP